MMRRDANQHGCRRFKHVRWSIVGPMGFAWTVTLPATALLGAVTLVAWNAIIG